MTDFSILPRLPGLLTAGSCWYALFLAGTALMSGRFLRQQGVVARHEPELLALAALAWAVGHLPAMFNPWDDSSFQAWLIALALGIAAALPGSPDRRHTLVGRVLCYAAACGLALWGALPGILLASAAAAGLFGLLARAFARHILLGLAALLLLEAINASFANVIEMVLFGLVSFWMWKKSGIEQRAGRLLLAGLLILPLLLTAAGSAMIQAEAGFRQEQVTAAHMRIELVKARVEILTEHAHDLLKIAAVDPIITAATSNPLSDHAFALRILSRRIGADAIFLTDTSGRILNTSDGSVIGLDISFRPYFTRAMAGESNSYFDRSLTRYAVSYFARPVLNDSAETVAVLVLRFNLEAQLTDYFRTDDFVIHRNGVILVGSNRFASGALFRDEATAASVQKERLFGQQDLLHLGYDRVSNDWLRHASGAYSMWASLPLPGGMWEAGKLIPTHALMDFRNNQMFLLAAMLSILLLLGLHYCKSNALLHLLLLENEARRAAEMAERAARVQIEESESRKSAILSAGLDCFITIDDVGRIIDFNSAAERTFGYRADEVHGRLLSEVIIPPELRTAHENGMARWRLSGDGPVLHQRIEITAMRRSGQILPVELAVVPFGSGERKYFAGFVRDISGRKALEMERQQLEVSQRQMVTDLAAKQFAIDQHALVSITTPDGAIIYANERLQALSGYSAQELIGSNHRLLKSGLQDAAFYLDMWRTISNGKVWHGEYANRRKDRDIYWVAATIVPMRNDEGQTYQYISIQTDITQQKRTERQLALFQEDLIKLLDQYRAAEVEIAQSRARELLVGAQIQRTLLFGRMPTHIGGLAIATFTQPSEVIDGDFYEFFAFDDESFDIAIGDVMGKGIPAALMGAAVKKHLNRSTAWLLSRNPAPGYRPAPEDIVNDLQHRVGNDLLELDSFVTLSYLRIDMAAGEAVLVDAGHLPVIQASEAGPRLLRGDNLPLGVLEDERYRQAAFPVTAGDLLFMYSDGITEACNSAGEEFGQDRLVDLIQRMHAAGTPPAMVVQNVRWHVNEFENYAVPRDDRTCIALQLPKVAATGTRVRHFELPRALDQLGPLRVSVAEAAQEAQLDEDSIQALVIAAFEAATNIVRHTPPRLVDATIHCSLAIQLRCVSVQLHYLGSAFTPHDREPDFSGESEGGFGLYIIRNSVDEVSYSTPVDGICCIHLTKTSS